MMPFARLFRSRWAALIWAAGILWTAIDVADSAPAPRGAAATDAPVGHPPAPGEVTDDPSPSGDVAALADLLGG